ncbi:hypothetical protein C8024_15200 [Sphingopyxis sp. BSNA05]|nr:hypothetical protein [Sphingopyxis sp. BSNA05]
MRAPEIGNAKAWKELVALTADATDKIMESVDEHLSSLQPGAQETQLNTWLRISTSFLKFLEAIKSELSVSAPFYLMLDDFDSLGAVQQRVLFTAAAERNHATLCYKFGSMTYGSSQKTTMSGASYRPGHDFDPISLNWVDGGLQNKRGSASYRRAVEDVAKKRLRHAGWPDDLKYASALDVWTKGIEYRTETVRAIREAEYDSVKGKNRRLFKVIGTNTRMWMSYVTAKRIRSK